VTLLVPMTELEFVILIGEFFLTYAADKVASSRCARNASVELTCKTLDDRLRTVK